MFLKQPDCRKYYGKQFSILGDSISTLDGYNPAGYNLFYVGDVCDKTGVYEVMDTWWGKVIEELGGELLVNNSWSGSRVTRAPGQDMAFPSGCSKERTYGLHIGNIMPDFIIIYLGINDWASGVPVNMRAFKSACFHIKRSESVFSCAYLKMLKYLKHNYPTAEICCCTLCETAISSNPDFKFPHMYGGTHIEEYNTVIRNVSKQAECRLIELYNNRVPYDTLDGTHPTVSGMSTLATLIMNGMHES